MFRLAVDAPATYSVAALGDTTGAFSTVSVVWDAYGQLVASEIVRLTSAPYGAVTGRVTGASSGTSVFALGTSFTAATDGLGDFVLSRVPAGSYHVVAGVPGAISTPVAVTVTAGEVAVLSEPSPDSLST